MDLASMNVFRRVLAMHSGFAIPGRKAAMVKRILAVIFISTVAASSNADQVSVLAWNVESDRHNRDTNDPNVIAEWLEDFDRYDIVALSEVADENGIMYIRASARDEGAFFFYKVGQHNSNDHLVLARDSFRFDTLQTIEIDGEDPGEDDLQIGSGGRAPLAVRLREKPDGPEFGSR